MMIRAVVVSLALLTGWHLDALASAPPFHAVSAVTQDGLAVCNPGPAMKQLPNGLFIGRGMSIQTRAVCNAGTYVPNPFIALFALNWQTGQFVLQNYIQRFPASGNGFVINTGYDPYTVEFAGEYWTAFECTVAPANQVSTCLAPLLPDLSGMDLSRLSVPVLGINGPNPAKPTQQVTVTSASAPMLLPFQGYLYLYWQVDNFAKTSPLIERGAALEQDWNGTWVAGSGGFWITPNDLLSSVVYDVVPGDTTRDFTSLLTDVGVTSDGFLMAIGVVGGTNGTPCGTPRAVSRGCWRVTISFATDPLAPNTFGQNAGPASFIPENPFDYARIIVDPEGNHWLLGNLQLPFGGVVQAGYAPSETTVGVGYVPWAP